MMYRLIVCVVSAVALAGGVGYADDSMIPDASPADLVSSDEVIVADGGAVVTDTETRISRMEAPVETEASPVAVHDEKDSETSEVDVLIQEAEVLLAEAGADQTEAPVEPVSEVLGDEASATQLSSLIQEALKNNGELGAARMDEEAYRGKSHYERKDWFPKMAVYHTYDTQPDTAEPDTNPARQSERTWRKAYGLTTEQLIFDWGETRGKVHQKSHEAESYGYKAMVKEAEIAYKIREAYWRVVLFQEVVGLRQKALESKKKEVGSVADRAKANKARKADLLMAEAQQGQAEQDLLEAENGLALAKERLLYYVGRDTDGDISISDTLTGSDTIQPEDVNIESHPDMKRVRAAQEAARSAELSAKAGRLPKLFFRGHIEDSTPEPGADAGNLTPDGYNYQLGLYVSVPFGQQWVGASGKLREARARQAQYAEEAKALKGAIKLKVHKAQNRLSEAIKALEVAGKQKDAAAEKLNATHQMAEAKNATQADVARAEDDAANADIGVMRALYDVKEAEADLLREMGRTVR